MDDEFVALFSTSSYLVTFVVEDALEAAGIEYRKDDSDMLHERVGSKTQDSIGTLYLVRKSQVDAAKVVVDKSLDELEERMRARKEGNPDSECLACGSEIPDASIACPKCGWSFAAGDENA